MQLLSLLDTSESRIIRDSTSLSVSLSIVVEDDFKDGDVLEDDFKDRDVLEDDLEDGDMLEDDFDVDTLLKDDFIYVYSSIISTVSLLLRDFIPSRQVCGWTASAFVLPVQLSRCWLILL